MSCMCVCSFYLLLTCNQHGDSINTDLIKIGYFETDFPLSLFQIFDLSDVGLLYCVGVCCVCVVCEYVYVCVSVCVCVSLCMSLYVCVILIGILSGRGGGPVLTGFMVTYMHPDLE